MKKLNRKGFTLVELLAVIVILAIVVGITLVTVLPTLQKTRQDAFEVTAQTAADTIEKQYQLSLIGQETTLTKFGTSTSPVAFTAATIESVGLKPENYVAGSYYVNSTTGRACVVLYASTRATATLKSGAIYNLAGKAEAGEYYDATAGKSVELTVRTAAGSKVQVKTKYSMAQSSGC